MTKNAGKDITHKTSNTAENISKTILNLRNLQVNNLFQ